MKITERQLRRIIRESLKASEVLTTPAQFKSLQPGDRLSLNGRPIVVIQTSSVSADVDYVEQGSSKQRYFDYRYALADDPNELPEYDVIYLGSGPAPENTRLQESAYDSDPIRSAFDSGMSDAQDGMEPESYHDWIAEDPELMDAYDAGYEEGLNNPAPKSKMSNDEFKRIYGDMDVGVRGKAGY